ncbi:hypothetical protein HU200_003826 [Digitaria exilis]|uniref:Uncharacterized protein n=1 Tax=Digitaria exilis TaxID=1010633 RepID=A0A835KUB4_9POAL|nr:hypothetical protein HU200_003826 [Digitaria exilis]
MDCCIAASFLLSSPPPRQISPTRSRIYTSTRRHRCLSSWVTGHGRGGWWPASPRRATAASAARAGTRTRAATSARGSARASRGGGACRRRWGTPRSCRPPGAGGGGRAPAGPATAAAGWAPGAVGPAVAAGCGGDGRGSPSAAASEAP